VGYLTIFGLSREKIIKKSKMKLDCCINSTLSWFEPEKIIKKIKNEIRLLYQQYTF